MLPFENAEYQDRLAPTRTRMREQGLDALWVTDPANMYYLTGYNAWSFYTPQGVLVPADGDPLLFAREMDAHGAHLTTFLGPDRILGYPEDHVQQRDRHPMDWVASRLDEHGLAGTTLGVELDSYFFTPRAHEALRAGLARTRFVDSAELVNWVRAVKSPAELELMRRAARTAERAMSTAVEVIEPGVRQCDAAAAIVAAQAGGSKEHGGDYPAIVPMLATGAGTATPHLTWSDATFVRGEGTSIELAGCHARYHCPMARTVFLGDPPQRLRDTAAVVAEGLEQALDAARPGVICEQIEQAWRAVIGRHGLAKESRIGYSIGIGYPPDWGEHTMSLRPGDRTVVTPGMTFHVILGMWMDGWGYELSEAIVVTETGAQCLCDFPRQLFVKS